ncbi:MAG: hypothetical protein OXG83_10115 [Acidobacteria bacterium]|nr:hypothetical protein [Acidobacteriota bacterium]
MLDAHHLQPIGLEADQDEVGTPVTVLVEVGPLVLPAAGLLDGVADDPRRSQQRDVAQTLRIEEEKGGALVRVPRRWLR